MSNDDSKRPSTDRSEPSQANLSIEQIVGEMITETRSLDTHPINLAPVDGPPQPGGIPPAPVATAAPDSAAVQPPSSADND